MSGENEHRREPLGAKREEYERFSDEAKWSSDIFFVLARLMYEYSPAGVAYKPLSYASETAMIMDLLSRASSWRDTRDILIQVLRESFGEHIVRAANDQDELAKRMWTEWKPYRGRRAAEVSDAWRRYTASRQTSRPPTE